MADNWSYTVFLWGAQVHKMTVLCVWEDSEYDAVREQNAKK